jgi:hypothetical protein
MYAESPMPHGKDATVDSDQVPCPRPVLDQSFIQTHGDQLPPGNDSVLFLRELADCKGRLTSGRNALFTS